MKNEAIENRLNLERNRAKIPDEGLSLGSTRDKFPVVLDDGKTVIYVSDKRKLEETRLKYESHRNSRITTYHESYIS